MKFIAELKEIHDTMCLHHPVITPFDSYDSVISDIIASQRAISNDCSHMMQSTRNAKFFLKKLYFNTTYNKYIYTI